jgi:hypothetical protein
MKISIASIFQNLSNLMTKISADEELLPPVPDESTDVPEEPIQEEKDQDTLLQEHVKNNIDKYRTAFESLFPKAQMVARNVEYHGAVTKDKIRVLVDFETPLLNFDALQILSDKEIGLEATGENTYKVYNIYLPKIKDSTIQ